MKIWALVMWAVLAYICIAVLLALTLVPGFETDHHHGVGGAASGEGETGHLVVGLDLLDIADAPLHLGENVVGLGQGSTGRCVHADEERAGILVGNEGGFGGGHEVHKEAACHYEGGYAYPLVGT